MKQTMNLVFGQVQEEYQFDEAFKNQSSTAGFYFKLEVEDDVVILHDTCGRCVPVDLEHLDTLIDTLLTLKEYRVYQARVEGLMECASP